MGIADILVVDDEVSFVETFSERLELRDFEISKAFSGQEALKVLEENKNIKPDDCIDFVKTWEKDLKCWESYISSQNSFDDVYISKLA